MTTGSILPETLGFVAKGTIIIIIILFGAMHGKLSNAGCLGINN